MKLITSHMCYVFVFLVVAMYYPIQMAATQNNCAPHAFPRISRANYDYSGLIAFPRVGRGGEFVWRETDKPNTMGRIPFRVGRGGDITWGVDPAAKEAKENFPSYIADDIVT